ncbi:hypothetical protein PI125_g6347 [Phytophthora idaei]|nr:hypothetical protein PI125_g6347 [Phytophthora idaei]
MSSFQNPPPRGEMVTLYCAIVGAAASVFEVEIDDAKSVSALKEAIKKKDPITISDEDVSSWRKKNGRGRQKRRRATTTRNGWRKLTR